MKKWLLLIGMLLSSQGAMASCDCTRLSLEDAVSYSTLIFAGRVYEITDGVPVFEIGLPMKGQAMQAAKVRMSRTAGDPDCAIPVTMGQQLYIFAVGNFEQGYETDACLMQAEPISLEAGQTIIRNIGNRISDIHGLQFEAQVQPENAVTARQLADAYLKAGMGEAAARQAAYVATLTDNAEYDLLVRALGLVQMGASMADKALQAVDDVLEINPDNRRAWQGRYKALAYLGRWSEIPAGSKLHKLTFADAPLSGAAGSFDLSESWFVNVRQDGNKLAGSNLTATRFIDAKILGSDFTGALFNRARLTNTEFSDSNLSGSNFSLSRLEKVRFTNSSLENADFTGAQLEDVDFSGADLTGAKLDKVSAKNVKWPAGFTPPTAASTTAP